MKTINVANDLKEFIEDAATTDDIAQAIFIMEDGTLIDGEFDCGTRGDDHNELLSYFEGMTWAEIHQQLKVIRLVPETNFALIGKDQKLNAIQNNLLANSNYQVAEY